KYTLMENPKAAYEALKAQYATKVGTVSRVGGICTEIPYTTELTEGYGYYVNSDIEDVNDVKKLGNMYYSGYIDKCLVEIHFVKKPGLAMEDIEKLIYAAYPVSSGKSAKSWAEAFDLNKLSQYSGAPYAITADSNDSFAKIADSENKRYIAIDTSADAAENFKKTKAEYMEKGKNFVLDTSGYDDGYGIGALRTPNALQFHMVYFAGLKDGCFIDVVLRIDSGEYTASDAEQILKAILGAEPA
ncbi:MAG: hypothetical protein J5494_02375, partial [Candidatus Methanomethylophilaceae archaeon]|nr:hypothetical protein [Candidatus Methanomethylophilaceae archaeon]